MFTVSIYECTQSEQTEKETPVVKTVHNDKNAKVNPFFPNFTDDGDVSSSDDDCLHMRENIRTWVTTSSAYHDSSDSDDKSDISSISARSTPVVSPNDDSTSFMTKTPFQFSQALVGQPPAAPSKKKSKSRTKGTHLKGVVHNLAKTFDDAAKLNNTDDEITSLKKEVERLTFRGRQDKIKLQTAELNLTAAKEETDRQARVSNKTEKKLQKKITKLLMESNELRMKVAEYERQFEQTKQKQQDPPHDYAEDVEDEEDYQYEMSRDELEANCNYYRHEMIKWRKRACHMIQEYETLEKEYEGTQPITYNYTHDEISPWGHQDEDDDDYEYDHEYDW